MREKRPNTKLLLPALAVVVLGLAILVPVNAASSSSYFQGYSAYATHVSTWKSSMHKDVACVDCHPSGKSGLAASFAAVGEYYKNMFGGKSAKPTFITLPKATKDGCIKCHGNDQGLFVSRQLKVPHPAHLRIADEKRNCVDCHKWVAHEEKYKEKHKTLAFTGICLNFACHSGTKTTDECQKCHHSKSNQSTEWRKMHPEVVLSRGTNSCLDSCHQVNQCRTCHTTGENIIKADPIKQVGFISEHSDPNWKTYKRENGELTIHGKEALADDARCYVCHERSACDNCHATRPAFHGAKDTWLHKHRDFASDRRVCLRCHKTYDWCNQCHRTFGQKELR